MLGTRVALGALHEVYFTTTYTQAWAPEPNSLDRIYTRYCQTKDASVNTTTSCLRLSRSGDQTFVNTCWVKRRRNKQ